MSTFCSVDVLSVDLPKINLIISVFSSVENQNNLELDFKVFFFADSCCSDIVVDESN